MEAARATGRRRLLMVMAITVAALLFQFVGGLLTNSLALIADAGHLFADLTGVGLAWFASWIATRPASDTRTFGFYRAEILAAVANAVILLGVAIFVLLEAWQRLSEAPDVASGPMLVIALIGGAANAVCLYLLHDVHQHSLNLRGAYLEVLGDLLGSGAVVIAAIVITLTGFTAADSIASLVIGLLIVPRTLRLLREAVDVLLEATPRGIDLGAVRTHLQSTPGVSDVHDLHAWTITSGMPVVSVHIVLEPSASPSAVLDALCRCLADDFDVEHSTIQLEAHDRRRFESTRHP